MAAQCRCFFLFVLTSLLIGVDGYAQDGSSDLSWPNYGGFTIDGNVGDLSAETRLGTVILESSGNLLLAGKLATSSWWLGELTADGAFVTAFGAGDGSGRVTACQLGNCTPNPFLGAAVAGNHYVVSGANRFLLTGAAAHSIDASTIPPLRINDVGGVVFPAEISIDAAGRIVVAGPGFYSAEDVVNNNARIGVARLTSAFGLDPTFHAVVDGNGVTFAGGTVVTYNKNADKEAVEWLRVMPGGRILLLARSETPSHTNQIAVRMNSDGTLDDTYVNGGFSPIPFHGTEVVDASGFLDPAGRLLVTGLEAADSAMLASMLDSNGFLAYDAIIYANQIECLYVTSQGIVMDSAGRILIGGECVWSYNSTPYIIVARFRTSGSSYVLDQTFGAAEVGWILRKFDGNAVDTQFSSLIMDGGGRPIVGGISKLDAGAAFKADISRLQYGLSFPNGFEEVPRGCLPPDCG